MKYWYAVMQDNEDNDWGYGSYDLAEAQGMVAKYPEGYIAVIDESGDPICVEEIRMKRYYMANPEHSDAIYGDEIPVCIELAEVKRLACEWGMTTDELLEQMHEASTDEIEEWGVCNG